MIGPGFFSSASWKFIERFATHLLSAGDIFYMNFEIMRRFFNLFRCCLRYYHNEKCSSIFPFGNECMPQPTCLTLSPSVSLSRALRFDERQSVAVSQSSSRSTCFESIFRNFHVFQIGSTRQDKTDCDVGRRRSGCRWCESV